MRLAPRVLMVLVAFLPVSAAAVDVELGASAEAVYDDNVFRTSDNPKEDASFRLSPKLRVKSQDTKLGASLFYIPTYEAFATYTDANNWTHQLGTTFDYAAGEKTTLTLDNQFRVLDVLNYTDDDTIDEGVPTIPNNDIEREQVILDDATFNVSHQISSHWTSDTNLGFSSFNADRRNTVDSMTVSAFQNFNYALDAADLVGIGGGVVVQMFDEVTTLPASNTFVYRLFGSWAHEFGDSTTLSVRVGPAYIVTDQDNAPFQSTGNDEYPYILVDRDTTVGQLNQRQNVNIDDFGQGLTDATPVPAGSVVVPDSGQCVGAAATALFEGSRCAFHRLLRNDAAFPAEQAPIPTITSSLTDVTLLGSNSGSDDGQFTVFGEVLLTQRWTPLLSSTLSYSRSESTASGQGTTTIADTVSLLTVWRPSELWDLSARASYVRRKSPTALSRTFLEVTGDAGLTSFDIVQLTGNAVFVEDNNSVDTERWGITARAARRLTRHITVAARTAYSNQSSKHTSRNPNNFSNFTAILGFQYDFAPFRF